ncbi:MAG: hypothetical protein ACRD8W_31630, partial [Nitrososphaeraceae archaeon]
MALEPLTTHFLNVTQYDSTNQIEENGDEDYDEINVVEPGFNSGWEQLMEPIAKNDIEIGELVFFPGSHYSDPVFSFIPSLGLTDIEFL